MLIEMIRLMAAEHWNAVRHNDMPVDSAVSTFFRIRSEKIVASLYWGLKKGAGFSAR
jgi:hypothetical protein